MKTKRISQVVNLSDYESEITSMDEILGHPLVVADVFIQRGHWGDYATIDAYDMQTEEAVTLQTGSKMLVKVFRVLLDTEALPVTCCILQHGRSYQVTDAAVPRGFNPDKLFTGQQTLPLDDTPDKTK